MDDLGGIDIADDVMIGPNVSLITSSHPIEPSRRRDGVIAKPIQIERNVWLAAADHWQGRVFKGLTVPHLHFNVTQGAVYPSEGVPSYLL